MEQSGRKDGRSGHRRVRYKVGHDKLGPQKAMREIRDETKAQMANSKHLFRTASMSRPTAEMKEQKEPVGKLAPFALTDDSVSRTVSLKKNRHLLVLQARVLR